jgi:adenine-specific DNA-methyltransferase
LAHGLAVFLNSTAVDQDFRRFNGHTQVNATDLRRIKYPNHDALVSLGQWAMDQSLAPSQAMIDDQFAKLAA